MTIHDSIAEPLTIWQRAGPREIEDSIPELLELVLQAGRLMDIPLDEIQINEHPEHVSGCCCPHCEKETLIIPVNKIKS